MGCIWFGVCWCYVVVWLWWCGIRMQAEALVLQPAYGYHTTIATLQRNTNIKDAASKGVLKFWAENWRKFFEQFGLSGPILHWTVPAALYNIFCYFLAFSLSLFVTSRLEVIGITNSKIVPLLSGCVMIATSGLCALPVNLRCTIPVVCLNCMVR